MKGRDKLLALADRLHAEDGAACVYVKKGCKTERFSFGYRQLFGKRFLLIRDGHGLPVAFIPTNGGAPEKPLRRLPKEEYSRCEGLVPADTCGAVYPLSVIQGFQSGEIFVSGGNILLWHKCGFAFIFGSPDKALLDEIYDRFLSPGSVTDRRFVLFAADGETAAYFAEKPGIQTGRRYFFVYPHDHAPQKGELPEGLTVKETAADNIALCNGRITPLFSWDSREDFLGIGRGFCVMDGSRAAAWAFSAAVSSTETDIGVETAEEYRHRGLASAAARAMTEFILSEGKRPVWACSSENEGSRRLAEKLGFVKTAECYTISKGGR